MAANRNDISLSIEAGQDIINVINETNDISKENKEKAGAVFQSIQKMEEYCQTLSKELGAEENRTKQQKYDFMQKLRTLIMSYIVRLSTIPNKYNIKVFQLTVINAMNIEIAKQNDNLARRYRGMGRTYGHLMRSPITIEDIKGFFPSRSKDLLTELESNAPQEDIPIKQKSEPKQADQPQGSFWSVNAAAEAERERIIAVHTGLGLTFK